MLKGPCGVGGHGEKKSRKKAQAIACLLAYPTQQSAARAAGIHPVTLNKWLHAPEFKAEYERAREKVLETASEQLRLGAVQAVEVLRTIAANKKAAPAARVTAARSFLEATGLLKGLAVTVNNQFIPQDQEGLTAEIVKQLSGMLRTDERLREAVKGMLTELERERARKEGEL